MGTAYLAISHDEQSSHGNGPDDGNERSTIHRDLGGDDDRNDVSHSSPNDPHVYSSIRRQKAKVSSLCPNLGLRQCLSVHLDAVRSSGLSSRPGS